MASNWNNKPNNTNNIYQIIKDKLKLNKDGKCINAMTIISDPDILMAAYKVIRSDPGNMTEGIDKTTLDGINIEWFKKTSEQLVNESWKPNPVRRVYIPKANGKRRPIGVCSPREKIVQQSMKMVLEVILNPKFSDHSHGFRPKRGCHTALRTLRDWKGVAWFIEGDIVGFFDNIDHKLLESLLIKHFKDARLIHLYWKFVRAGYVEWKNNRGEHVTTEFGVPQGGTISPILSNLMLHELDTYVEELMKKLDEHNIGLKPYRVNPKYHNITTRLSRLKKKIQALKQEGKEFIGEKKKFIELVKERKKYKSIIPNPEYIKVRYVRYADDWLIGVWGTKKYATHLKEKLATRLKELKLELSEEKTFITNARSDRAKFLGTYIKRMASDVTLFYRSKKGRKKMRIPSGNIWMTAPMEILIQKLKDKGFLGKEKFIPRPITKFITLPVPDIILRFNTIISGTLNYYSFSDNRSQLSKIVWIIKECLRKTLSRKLKINQKTFQKKFGKGIVTNITNRKKKNKLIKFIQPDLTRRPMRFLGLNGYMDPFAALYLKVSSRNIMDQKCASCGSSENIEMHHLKHIKTINLKLNKFDAAMARINRKQVPLCKKCHWDVHSGRYQGKSLKYMKA